ncbi:Hypothetical predicted protein [Lynx pardinus]|uniref:Immunoglobulin domain-containing protein n=1 Tax=Lynx pardinus TaxID=191816 RepID=A0A485PPS7_LYNPA|nr:Hypothetical predicted protein [Lynx pardinus]
MGPRLLYCMAFCLLGAGPLDAEVTQTPGHLVKGKGHRATMYCVPIKGHSYVFWYQQILAKEFKFLISFQNEIDKTGMHKEGFSSEDILDKTEKFEDQFSAQCPKNSPCSLEIKSTEPGDSALYFCASSESTVLNVSFS